MSKHKHNYSQYSNKPKHENTKVADELLNPIAEAKMDVEPEVVKPNAVKETTAVVRPALVNETIETKTLPETVSGMVVGCAKLNVRKEPNLTADIVCALNVQSEIEIDVEKSNKEWFYICTATGIEGYCMRKFVEAHL